MIKTAIKNKAKITIPKKSLIVGFIAISIILIFYCIFINPIGALENSEKTTLILNMVKFTLMSEILIIASYNDYTTRLASDKFWIALLVVGLINFSITSVIYGALCFIPMFLVAMLFTAGGSDVKCVGVCGFIIGSYYALFGLLLGLMITCISFFFMYTVKIFIKEKKQNLSPISSPFFWKSYSKHLFISLIKAQFPLIPYLSTGFIIVAFFAFFIL